MGYFDALTSASFKTGPAGEHIFFPWGSWGRGYVLPSEEAFQRVRGHLRLYYLIMLPAVVAAVIAFDGFKAIIVLPFVMIAYLLWTRMTIRRLPRSRERMSYRESMTNQAKAYGAGTLWVLLVLGIVMTGSSVAVLFVQPADWLIAALGIALFGASAVVSAGMLAIRRRTLQH